MVWMKLFNDVTPAGAQDRPSLKMIMLKKQGFINVFGLQHGMKLQSLGYCRAQGDVTCSPTSPAASSEMLVFTVVF